MRLVQNFPFACILLTLICAVVSSVLSARTARRVTFALISAVTAMTACVLADALASGESYVYRMGHYPAPWGNEIRAGALEAACMLIFCVVLLLSFVGGAAKAARELEGSKGNIFCILVDLCLLSLLALVYTNDLFTAYVFIEINTLAAAGLVMMRQNGRALVGGVRYLIMNLVGSNLFLVGVVLLYTITGHLLMANIHERVAELAASGQYRVPLTVVVGLMSVGLAMKCALFPFDTWLPGAYSNATPTASAALSSLVSKGYIFLLVKIYVRVLGLDVVRSLGILDVLFVFGAVGMVAGSVNALRARTGRMMIAYSSVAQIGYIYAAIGLGSDLAIACALWHMLAHALTKSMLFIASDALSDASGGSILRADLRGAFYRSPLAALAFTLGAANLTGIPLLSVFVTKLTMAQAAIGVGGRHMAIALAALAVSTLLNAAYFLGTASLFFSPAAKEAPGGRAAPGGRPTPAPTPAGRSVSVALAGFAAANLLLGFLSGPVFGVLTRGLAQFV